MDPIVWQSNYVAATPPPWPVPPFGTAVSRGLKGLCPACGEAHLFHRFLKIAPVCRSCGAPLGTARADDAPPYVTILLVGHIVIPLLLIMEQVQHPPDWVEAMIFLPMTVLLCLLLLQPIKGGLVGVMVSARMLTEPDPAG